MTTTSRQSIQTLATDLTAVLADMAELDKELLSQAFMITDLEGKIAAITAERDAAIAQFSEAEDFIAELDASNREKDATIATKDVVIAAKDEYANGLSAIIGNQTAALALLENEISRLKAELALYRPRFTIYNEMKSVPDLPLPPVKVIYQDQLWRSGVPQDGLFDIPFLHTVFAAIAADGITSVVIDDEGHYDPNTTNIRADRIQTTADMLNAARQHFQEVSLYCFPERSYSFVTGTAAENETRLASLKARTDARQAITDAITFFSPSFYFLNPIHNNETKRNVWIDTNVDNCLRVGSGKRIVPFLWPRLHRSVDPAMPWVDGPTWRSTLNKVGERCDGAVIFGRSGGDDPDPRAFDPMLAWWLETQAFMAARAQ